MYSFAQHACETEVCCSFFSICISATWYDDQRSAKCWTYLPIIVDILWSTMLLGSCLEQRLRPYGLRKRVFNSISIGIRKRFDHNINNPSVAVQNGAFLSFSSQEYLQPHCLNFGWAEWEIVSVWKVVTTWTQIQPKKHWNTEVSSLHIACKLRYVTK